MVFVVQLLDQYMIIEYLDDCFGSVPVTAGSGPLQEQRAGLEV